MIHRRRHTLDCKIKVLGMSTPERGLAMPIVSLASAGISLTSTPFALGSISEGARLRSYLSSLLIRYELTDPVSHLTRIQPSLPNSLITVPSLGAGPSWGEKRNGV